MNKKSIFRLKKDASEQVVGEGREWMAGAKEGWGRRQNEARGRGRPDSGLRGCRRHELFVAKLFRI